MMQKRGGGELRREYATRDNQQRTPEGVPGGEKSRSVFGQYVTPCMYTSWKNWRKFKYLKADSQMGEFPT
jgi:hypothetical protein